MIRKKIRVIHYCNQLSLGGTEKTMELFCQYLPKETFEIFAVSRLYAPPFKTRFRIEAGAFFRHKKSQAKKQVWNSMNARIPNFERLLGPDRLFFAQSDSHLRQIIASIQPDILHVHYSGNPESPIADAELMRSIPVAITTNQFELNNTSSGHAYVKKILFVSRWLLQNRALWAQDDSRANVLYNPVEKPVTRESLRPELGISPQIFVVGRVGRPDPGIHDPISLDAYAQMETERTLFLALSPPSNMVEQAKKLKLKNFRSLEPTTDPFRLSKFYNTIDVLAHARRDGETFGCNIAEAMIHGKPVISHISEVMDAQIEVIGSAGYVVGFQDTPAYARHLKELRDDPFQRATLSEIASKRALENFEASLLAKRLEEIYRQELLLYANKAQE